MTSQPESESFVLLRLSERRFAVAAGDIAELVAPSRIFRLPHQTKEVEGVVVRRGRIVPVIDVAARLLGRRLADRRFYLIAQRRYATGTEWIAIPVTGDCELIFADMIPASEADLPHVAGWLSHAGDVIEVLNLNALTPGPNPVPLRAPAIDNLQQEAFS
jgi:chemotaxis signal transduction protein